MKINKKNRKILNIILAVVIAIGVWLYVVNVENPTVSTHLRDIPVNLVGQNALEEKGLMVTEISQENVSFKVTGKKKTLMKLNRKNVSLSLDVESISQAGEWTLSAKTVYPSTVSADSVSVVNWNDLKVTITVEEQSSKQISVFGQFIGTVAENCMAGKAATDPVVLEIKGPEQSLAGVSYALAQVGGANISETLTQEVPVVLMGPDDQPAKVDHITWETDKVTVTVPVQRVVSIPLSVDLKDGGGATKDDVTCTIQPASVTVVSNGDGEALPASISLGTIDLAQVMGNTSYSMPISLPEGLTGWGAPAYATVQLTMDKLTARQIPVTGISFEHIPQGYTPKLVSDTLYVWVRGSEGAVKALTADQISVQVDLSGAALHGGLQRFPAKVSLKNGTEGAGILGTSYSVALRLTK